MRAHVLVAVATLVAPSCKDNDPAKRTPAPAAAPDPAPPPKRAPLVRPDVDAPAIEGAYGKARHVARGVLAQEAPTADAILVYGRDWNRAPPALRSLGSDARSGEVATLVTAGAASADGLVPEGPADQWAAVGAVAVAHAAERASRGEAMDAAWLMLAAVRMGFDITLGRAPPAAKHGLNLVDGALAALRSVVGRAGADALPNDELGRVLAACRGLMASAPTEPSPMAREAGGGGKWTEGEWSYRYRRSSAALSATCFAIARALETRGVDVTGEPIVDPVSGKPWQVVDGVIRGGELEHQGARERIEFKLMEASQ